MASYSRVAEAVLLGSDASCMEPPLLLLQFNRHLHKKQCLLSAGHSGQRRVTEAVHLGSDANCIESLLVVPSPQQTPILKGPPPVSDNSPQCWQKNSRVFLTRRIIFRPIATLCSSPSPTIPKHCEYDVGAYPSRRCAGSLSKLSIT